MRLPGNCILFTLFNKSRIKLLQRSPIRPLQHPQEVLRLDEPVERRLELVLCASVVQEVARCCLLANRCNVFRREVFQQHSQFFKSQLTEPLDWWNVAVFHQFVEDIDKIPLPSLVIDFRKPSRRLIEISAFVANFFSSR